MPLMNRLKIGNATYDVCDGIARAAGGGGSAGMSANAI